MAFMLDQDSEAHILHGISDDELQDFLSWRVRVRGTNISEKILLATDYLNHFNEIVMLIEMVPDMPDMMEECRIWQPKSYQQHFRDSGFSEKELAIEAYDHVPNKFRTPFEATIAQMDAVVMFTVSRMDTAVAAEDPERLRFDCATSVEMLHKIMQVANGIIHGSAHVMQQTDIDAYMGV
jgi:hypothetical protein